MAGPAGVSPYALPRHPCTIKLLKWAHAALFGDDIPDKTGDRCVPLQIGRTHIRTLKKSHEHHHYRTYILLMQYPISWESRLLARTIIDARKKCPGKRGRDYGHREKGAKRYCCSPRKRGQVCAPTYSSLCFDPHAGAIGGDVDPAGSVSAEEGCVLQSSQGLRIGQAIQVRGRDAEDGQLRLEAGQPAGWVEGGGTGSSQEQNRKWRKGGVFFQAGKAVGIQTDG
jgi:hypothetical protein